MVLTACLKARRTVIARPLTFYPGVGITKPAPEFLRNDDRAVLSVRTVHPFLPPEFKLFLTRIALQSSTNEHPNLRNRDGAMTALVMSAKPLLQNHRHPFGFFPRMTLFVPTEKILAF